MKLTPVIFGTSCLGNLYTAIPMETKVAIAAEWFKAFERPVIDSAGKYGAGLSLECIGKALKTLGKTRRGSQGASRAAPGKSCLHARGEKERVIVLESWEGPWTAAYQAPPSMGFSSALPPSQTNMLP